MPFLIVRNDIARVRADVLVNAANERLAAGGSMMPTCTEPGCRLRAGGRKGPK